MKGFCAWRGRVRGRSVTTLRYRNPGTGITRYTISSLQCTTPLQPESRKASQPITTLRRDGICRGLVFYCCNTEGAPMCHKCHH
ncbi:hypothetical protein GDO78_004764 [Eleutherodactylus coqui]|uniref:Uncharacterized protein n=1 Tax=Eleutherodactylus coqui TaxID=57060 RepID=A0A8J6JYN7_ELECQ|nr:hypothetical protein GDO78_004764 [Eleutherodactylus coqui]